MRTTRAASSASDRTLRVGRVGGVAEPRLGRAPGEGPDGGDHPAVVLQVVVGVEDVVLAVVLVLDRDLDGGEAPAHRLGRGLAVAVAAVGEARPRQVHLGEVVVGAPRALLDARRGCPSRSRRAAARRCGRRRRRRRATGFCSAGSSSAATSAHGVVEQGDDVREGVAEEAGDAQGHVDPGPAQLGQRDRPRGR